MKIGVHRYILVTNNKVQAILKRLFDKNHCTANIKQYAVAAYVQLHCNCRNSILLLNHSAMYKYVTLKINIAL